MSSERAPKGHPRIVWGEMLRHIREASGLSREELAAGARLSPSTIRAYEDGWRAPVRDTVEQQIEPAPGLRSHGVLLKLWDEFEEAMNYGSFPAFVADLADKEAAATAIRWYAPMVVPGLLQTGDYARAIQAATFGITAEEVEQQVAERLQRQEILARDKPPELRTILDESVLHRLIAARHVMAEQTRRLIEAADAPSTTILVIPADTGAHEGLSGEFQIMDSEDKPGFGFLETALGGQSVPEADGVAVLNRRWATLAGEATSRKSSKALLEEAYKRWTRPT
ncbi:MAG TPA: helix-turn-helix transcriptional regulator [Streptosporangiaceae bacterium]|nr:helix-turn-helix transcriptional regulator [Streptosporangiaceae bacterium]